MKIIDAYWEERNLGMKVCELVFTPGDDLDLDVLPELEKSFDYIIAKIPGECISVMHHLEEKGFRYLENQQVIYFPATQLQHISYKWIERFSKIDCDQVTDQRKLEIISDHIRKGLYLKGRISADPLLEKGISDLRIVNWLHDLFLKRGVTIHELKKDDDLIGYFALEQTGKRTLNIVQAGIFREFQNKGFSFSILLNVLKIAKSGNYSGISASVSTGNFNTLNSIARFVNFSVKETYIVARKITDRTR